MHSGGCRKVWRGVRARTCVALLLTDTASRITTCFPYALSIGTYGTETGPVRNDVFGRPSQRVVPAHSSLVPICDSCPVPLLLCCVQTANGTCTRRYFPQASAALIGRWARPMGRAKRAGACPVCCAGLRPPVGPTTRCSRLRPRRPSCSDWQASQPIHGQAPRGQTYAAAAAGQNELL